MLVVEQLKQTSWKVWLAGGWLLGAGSVALYFLWSSLPLLALVFITVCLACGALTLTVWSICTMSDFYTDWKWKRDASKMPGM